MDAAPRHRSSIDPGLVPAVLWTRDYLRHCDCTGGSTELTIALRREDGTASLFRTQVLAGGVDDEATYLHVERTVKFLLWSRGASDILLCGHEAAGLVLRLQADYSPKGCRAFDANFFCKVFERPLLFREVSASELPVASTAHLSLGRNLEGCRIGFDLGGSDRKCAALIDGKVVFSEEVKWDPYFQSDPAYHLAGIRHSLDLAASHLPRVDAIGGSSAGVYVNNKVRVASLFRGITDVGVFDSQVRDCPILRRSLRSPQRRRRHGPRRVDVPRTQRRPRRGDGHERGRWLRRLGRQPDQLAQRAGLRACGLPTRRPRRRMVR